MTVSSGGMYTQRLDLARLDLESTAGPHPDFDGVHGLRPGQAGPGRAQRRSGPTARPPPASRSTPCTRAGSTRPGWPSSLPGFARVMGPWLRTPFQGADTMVWLATAREPLERQRRASGSTAAPRWPVKLPWTRTAPDDADRLWRWVAARAGVPTRRGPCADDRSSSLGWPRSGHRMEATTPRSDNLVLNTSSTGRPEKGTAMKIAIVGTGISGLVCAHLLHPAPRHHRVRGRRPRRRPHQHRRRRAPVADGDDRDHASTPASSSTTSATTRASSRLLDQLGVATQPERDELQRQRSRASGSSTGAPTSTRSSPSAATWPSPCVPPHAGRHRAVQPLGPAARSADARRRPAEARPRRLERARCAVGRYSDAFVERFLVPFGASIWSADPDDLHPLPGRGLRPVHGQPRPARAAGQPAVAHGHRAAPARYVEALTAPFADRIRTQLAGAQDRATPRTATTASRSSSMTRPTAPRPSTGSSSPATATRPSRLLGDASPAEREILGRDRLPAQRGDAAHRRAVPARATAGPGPAGTTTSASGDGARRGHADLLDEPAAVASIRPPAARHAQPPRRDRPGHRARRVRVRPPGVRRRPPWPAQRRRHEIQGVRRHLLRRRLLGLRLPRGRRALARSTSAATSGSSL